MLANIFSISVNLPAAEELEADLQQSESDDVGDDRQAETHSIDEVLEAIRALGFPKPETLEGEPIPSPPPWRRLRYAARKSLRRYAVDDPARDDHDLLQEALIRLAAGRRHWRRKVDFEYQVMRTMDSIASHWRRRAEWWPEICEAGLEAPRSIGEEEADETGTLLDPPSPEPNVEHRLLARVELEKVERLLVGDPEAVAVLECFRRELDRPEMVERTGLPEKRLKAILQRIRRLAGQSPDPGASEKETEDRPGSAVIRLNVAEAKDQFSELLRVAEGGETVVITRYGKPIARLAPPEAAAGGRPGRRVESPPKE